MPGVRGKVKGAAERSAAVDSAMGGAVVVLAGTTHQGNIGFCARAMKTMGAADLRLAAPRAQIGDEAAANSSNATDILERCSVHDDLRGALEETRFVVALSARRRRVSVEHRTLRDAAGIAAAHLVRGTRVALLLGNEKMGLSNEEAALADTLAEIPASASYPSLNLSHALQVALYELRRQVAEKTGADASGTEDPRTPAGVEYREQMFAHFERVARAAGVVGEGPRRPFLARLRRILMRASLDRDEVSMLRGFLTAVEKQAGKKN